MGSLVLKLAITPLLILAASLAGRRWGDAVGGWLIGLPLTSGPLAFFLALDQGERFAADAAIGSLGGTAAQAGFCLAYGWCATRGWVTALAVGTLGFAVVGFAQQASMLTLVWLLPTTAAVLLLAVAFMPRGKPARGGLLLPGWDLPARMLVATALVVGLTAAAPLLGPRLSGLLGTFPVFGMVLGVFAHRLQGTDAARQVLWGLMLGMFSCAGFFLVLALALEPAGIALGFLAACLGALGIQGATLAVMRRRRG